MTGSTSWLVARTAWWGSGRWLGPCALALEGHHPWSAPATPARPVPVESVPENALVRIVPGTLLPGLVDAHVHSALVDTRAVRAGGISGCQDLGGEPGALSRSREASRAPGSGLPTLEIAGAFLTAPGGYPTDRPWAPPGSCREVRGAADAADAVSEQALLGSTCVKVTLYPAAGPVLTPGVLDALVTAAHRLGLPVVVHAEGDGTVAAALSAGADALAHTPWTPLDGALIRDCARQLTWISTLDIHGWGEPSPAQDVAVDNLRRFLDRGGRVRYGTDLGNGPLPLGVNPSEIRALQRAGLSPDAVLDAMTDVAPGARLAPCWVPGGLDLDPARFADSLATARVIDDGEGGAGGPGEPGGVSEPARG